MPISDDFSERLKWAIYEFIGAISVMELAKNTLLHKKIEDLVMRLRSIRTYEG
jgi:hypothetical protein